MIKFSALSQRRTMIAAITCGACVLGGFAYFFVKRPPAETTSLQPRTTSFAARPVAEFEHVVSLVLSNKFMSSHDEGPELVSVLLDTAVDILVLTNDGDGPLEKEKWYQDKTIAKHSRREAIKALAIAHESMWPRDFGPLFATWDVAGLKPQLALVDLIYRDVRSLDDTLPYTLGLYLSRSVVHVPLYLDGGAFLSDGGNCYVALSPPTSAAAEAMSPRANEQASSESYLKAYLGCRNVVFFEDPPHAHIDMWAKIVDKETVFVNELSVSAVADLKLQLGHVPSSVSALQAQLDRAARQFASYLKVERLPMPLAHAQTFPTYANALLVNGHAILPAFEADKGGGIRALDEAFYSGYQERAAQLYQRHGYQVHFVKSDRLLEMGGSLHCVALQIPDVPASSRLF